MEPTSPVPANGLYRLLASTPSPSALADLPANSGSTASGAAAPEQPNGSVAGMVVKLIEARLYKILLLQAQRSILLKTEMPLQPGQIIQLVRDKAGGYQTGKILRLPLEVINQTIRQTLPMQRPLSRLLNRWLSQILAARDDPASQDRKPADLRGADSIRPDRPGMAPVRTKPVRTKPVRTKPVRTKPVRTKPVRTKPLITVGPRSTRNSSQAPLQLSRLIGEIPPNQHLRQPATVREQILNNGIFHESSSTDEKKAGGDLKGSLIQLKHQIERSIKSDQVKQEAARPTKGGLLQATSVGTSATTHPGADPGRAAARGLSTPNVPAMPEQARDSSTTQNGKTQQISSSQLSGLRNLLFQIHQAIARIQVFQLQSIHQQLSTQERNQWFMEIPVRSDDHIDVFNLQISEEPRHDEDPDSEAATHGSRSPSKQHKKWTINLEFDLPGLGPMTANLSIIDNSVSLSIWAEQRSTYETTLAHLDQLESNLRDRQLELEQISCHIGPATSAGPYTAPDETVEANPFQFSHLIDLNT